MTKNYLIKKKTIILLNHSNYPLKDLKGLLFSKFPSKSFNPSKIFLNCFIILLPILFSYLFFLSLFNSRHFRILRSSECDFYVYYCCIIIFIEKKKINMKYKTSFFVNSTMYIGVLIIISLLTLN